MVNLHLAGDGARHAGLGLAAQHVDATRHKDGLVHVVGDYDARNPELRGHLAVPAADVGAREGIERREGFVEQDDVVAHEVGAQKRRALSHAAGKLAGPLVLAAGKAEALDERTCLLARGSLGHACDDEWQDRVVENGAAREQQVLLQHVGDAPGHAADVLAVEQHNALARLGKARKRMQDGGLAAARPAHDADGLSGLHVQVDAADDVAAAVPGAREPARLEGGGALLAVSFRHACLLVCEQAPLSSPTFARARAPKPHARHLAAQPTSATACTPGRPAQGPPKKYRTGAPRHKAVGGAPCHSLGTERRASKSLTPGSSRRSRR